MVVRVGLSPEVVIDEAEAIVDREGSRNLTMTALARKLRVQGPSLYHHVGGVDALLAEVQVRALAGLANRLQRAAVGKIGAVCFRSLADELCSYAIEHPGLYDLSQSKPLDAARAVIASEPARTTLIAVIESFGIPDPPMELLLTCLAPLHGVLALDRSGVIGDPEQRTAVYRRATDLVIMLLETKGNT